MKEVDGRTVRENIASRLCVSGYSGYFNILCVSKRCVELKELGVLFPLLIIFYA